MVLSVFCAFTFLTRIKSSYLYIPGFSFGIPLVKVDKTSMQPLSRPRLEDTIMLEGIMVAKGIRLNDRIEYTVKNI